MEKKRTKSGVKKFGWWPVEKRAEVVAAYISLGRSNLVEAVTGVPNGTVRQWKTQDWWRELEYQLRSENNLEVDAKLQKIVNKSLDAVLDRVENGDFFYDVKTGSVQRTPAKLRDLAKVASEAVDKSVLLQKFTKRAEDAPDMQTHLEKLAQSFAEVMKTQIQAVAAKKERLIENDYAIHDERETRLLERVEVGAQEETQQGEGSSGEESGSVDVGTEERGLAGCGSREGNIEGGFDSVEQPESTTGGDEPLIQPQ